MYLFLGQDTVINSEDIIGIFDLDNASVSRATKSYLSKAQKAGNVIGVSTDRLSLDIPKSFVVCAKKPPLKRTAGTGCLRSGAAGSGSAGGARPAVKVYLSQISPLTLKKRAQYIKDIANL